MIHTSNCSCTWSSLCAEHQPGCVQRHCQGCCLFRLHTCNLCSTILSQVQSSVSEKGNLNQPSWRFEPTPLPPVQSTNQDVYNGTVKDLVTGVLHGINTTVFAYGSTGSGKTYTMVGESNRQGCIKRAFWRNVALTIPPFPDGCGTVLGIQARLVHFELVVHHL